MEEPKIRFNYLEDFKKEIDSMELPDDIKTLLERFIDMDNPIMLNLIKLVEEQKRLEEEIHRDTKEEDGWLNKEPLGNDMNAFIKNYNSFITFGREEINAWYSMVRYLLQDYLKSLNDTKQIKQRLEIEIKAKESFEKQLEEKWK